MNALEMDGGFCSDFGWKHLKIDALGVHEGHGDFSANLYTRDRKHFLCMCEDFCRKARKN